MALTDEAIERIKEMIVSGELRPGDRLPKEADLAERLGLSRNSLREAVRALSLIRVLDVRHGDGTYVTSLQPEVLLDTVGFVVDLHRDDSVLHLLEVRRILEPAATAMAAQKMTDDQLASLGVLVDSVGAAADLDDLIASDLEFHRRIAIGSGNPVEHVEHRADAAEWLKIRSVLSTYVVAAVLAVTVGLVTVLTWYVVLLYDRATPEQRAHVGLLEPAEMTAWVAELCMALFGVLAVTSEYRTGMIRTTLGAVPQRLTLLAAKAGVVAVVSLVTGMAALFGALFAGRSILGGRPIQGSTAPLSEAVQLVLASGLLVVVFALVGFGLGAVMRSAAAAIATVAALWYVLPIIALNLPAPWNDRASSVMLINLARELAGDEALLLSPPWALAAMAAYVTLSLGAAGLSITRRDA